MTIFTSHVRKFVLYYNITLYMYYMRDSLLPTGQLG